MDEFLYDASLGDDVGEVDEGDLHGNACQEEGNVVEVIENKDRLLHEGGLESRGAGSDKDYLAEINDIVHGFVDEAVVLLEVLDIGFLYGVLEKFLEVRPRAGDKEENVRVSLPYVFRAFEHGGEDPFDLVFPAAGKEGDEISVLRDVVFCLEIFVGLEFFYLVDDPVADVLDLYFAGLFKFVLGDE